MMRYFLPLSLSLDVFNKFKFFLRFLGLGVPIDVYRLPAAEEKEMAQISFRPSYT